VNSEQGLAAIVLGAGLGTRMRSSRAKVLHELAGEPIIVRTTRAFAALEPRPLILVVGHQAREVEAVARQRSPQTDLRFATQTQQRGTGDAARCAIDALPANFAGHVLIG